MPSAAPSARSLTIASALQVLIRVFGLFAGAATAAVQGRSLGPGDFASLSMLLAIALAGQTFVDLGLGKVATQRVAADPDAASAVGSALMFARLVLGVLAAVLGVMLGGTIVGTGEGWVAAGLILLGLPLSAITVLQALSEARLDVMAVNAIVLAQNVIWLLIVLSLYVAGVGLVWFAAGYAIAALLQAGIVWALSARGLELDLRGTARPAASLLRTALPLGVGALAVTAYYRLSGIILYERVGAEGAAGYFAGMRLLDAGQAIPATIGGLLLPLLSAALATGNNDRARTLWLLALKLVTLLSVVAACLISVLSEGVLLLLFGEEYGRYDATLSVLIFAYVPICLGWVVTSALIAAGELKVYSAVVIVVACVSIPGLLVGLSVFGASWAAITTVATEWLCVGTLLFVSWRRLGLGFSLPIFAKMSIVAAATAGLAYLLRGEGVMLSAAVALLGAVVSSLVLRVVSRSDLHLLIRRAEAGG